MLQFIKKLEVIRTRALVSFSRVNDNVSLSVSGMDWEEIVFTPASATLEVKPVQGKAGNLYESTLQCLSAVDDSTRSAQLARLEPYDLLCRITYNNDVKKVVGDKDMPSRLTVEQDVDNQSVFRYRFVCSSIYRPSFLIP